jgi:N-acetyl-anhydromuramyl-L-alanine amidase AmpD
MLIAAGAFYCQDSDAGRIEAPALKQYPILSEKRLELTREYARIHFGTDSISLDRPLMIVVHFTAISTLKDTLATFKPDLLPAGRTDIAGHGNLNVGVHYVVAPDGALYNLLPETVMGRHTIGFNWCAIGIEMVARGEKNLTEAELESTAHLVAWILSRHPSITYVIGHHEYMKKELPHFTLYREADASYKPTVKIDPGDAFMKKLREKLSGKFGLTPLD